MSQRGSGQLLLLCCAILCTTCDTIGFLDLCDPKAGNGRVGFYSVGDCVGSNLSEFRGHEWITLLGNRDPDAPTGQFFTTPQIDAIIDGNRHTDFPKELLVHFDTGALDYINALFAYHNKPEGQSEHFILKADNTQLEARDEALGGIRRLTHEAVVAWPDRQAEALAKIGKATHALQDSYSPAHAVRVRTATAPDEPWCFCKLKTFVPRVGAYATADIEVHDRLEDRNVGEEERLGDNAKPHTSALDSIYVSVRTNCTKPGGGACNEGDVDCTCEKLSQGRQCLDPNTPETVRACMKPEALQAVVASHDYLKIVRRLVVTGADTATIDKDLDAYFFLHFEFCVDPTVLLPEDVASDRRGMTCDRVDQ